MQIDLKFSFVIWLLLMGSVSGRSNFSEDNIFIWIDRDAKNPDLKHVTEK